MLDWLKAHWFLFTALAAMGVAWGAQQQKVDSIEKAVVSQHVINQQLQAQAASVEERTKLMLEQQRRQEQILLQILQQTRQR